MKKLAIKIVAGVAFVAILGFNFQQQQVSQADDFELGFVIKKAKAGDEMKRNDPHGDVHDECPGGSNPCVEGDG